MNLLLLLAAESATEPDITSTFLQYGAIGAMLVVLAFFANTLIKREQDRADRLEDDLRKYHELQADRTIPALVNASNAVASAQHLLEGVIGKTAEMSSLIADLKSSASVLKALIEDVKRIDK